MGDALDAWLAMQEAEAKSCGVADRCDVAGAASLSTCSVLTRPAESDPNAAAPPADVTGAPSARWSRKGVRRRANAQEQHCGPPQRGPEMQRKSPHWKASVMHPVRHVRASRGQRRRDGMEASMFSGLLSEDPAGHAIDIPAVFQFAMDNKPASYNWILANGLGGPDGPAHHFVDAREIQESTEWTCAKHQMNKCSPLADQNQVIDILVAGFSCRPYSTAREHRLSGGASKHPDSDLFTTFIEAMKLLKPDNGLAENVFGFSLPESTRDSKSPLERFIEDLKLHLPEYEISVFFLDGKQFLCMSRVRVWVALQHERIGGKKAAKRLKQIVQAYVTSTGNGCCLKVILHSRVGVLESSVL